MGDSAAEVGQGEFYASSENLLLRNQDMPLIYHNHPLFNLLEKSNRKA